MQAPGSVVSDVGGPHAVAWHGGRGLRVHRSPGLVAGNARTLCSRLARCRGPFRPVPLPGIAPTAVAVGEGAVWVGELDRKTLTWFNLVP